MVEAICIEIEETGHPVDPFHLAGEPQLGVDVFLLDIGQRMLDDERRTIRIEGVRLVHHPIGKHGGQVDLVGQVDLQLPRDAPIVHVDVRTVNVAAARQHAVEIGARAGRIARNAQHGARRDAVRIGRISHERIAGAEQLPGGNAARVTRAEGAIIGNAEIILLYLHIGLHARRIDADHLVGDIFGRVLGIVAADRQADSVARHPQELAADRLHIVPAQAADGAVVRLVIRHVGEHRVRIGEVARQLWRALAYHLAAEIEPAHIAVTLTTHAREHDAHRVADRHVDAAANVTPMIIADGDLEIARGVAEAGLSGDDVDRAAERIAPEQRALRPAQKVEIGAEQDRIIDVVDIISDRRFTREAGVGRGDAADIGRDAGTEGALGALEGRVGNDEGEIGDADEASLLKRLRIDCGDRERRILQIGRLTGRRYDDVANAALVFCGGRVLRERTLRQRDRQGRNRDKNESFDQLPLLCDCQLLRADISEAMFEELPKLAPYGTLA